MKIKKFNYKFANTLCAIFSFVGVLGITRGCMLFGYHEPVISDELLSKYED